MTWKKREKLVRLERQVQALPSMQNDVLGDIIKGLYQGKPLLGENGFIDAACERFNASGATRRDGCSLGRKRP